MTSILLTSSLGSWISIQPRWRKHVEKESIRAHVLGALENVGLLDEMGEVIKLSL